ncbi:hypothetical protein PR048_018958 [Dryococelus australis]|uniref:SH3 domain-containing protein n=1 Tax=Dryococelus australis TaxID=614101 RepID=A0ABQ9H276_9NEOP|nr:hypothetical protein PR048_018958 [Dryococelus australis]
MMVIEASMEQHHNERAGKMVDPQENPSTSGIVHPARFPHAKMREWPGRGLNPVRLGGAEMMWVIADHVAAAGSQELSVHKGQQVEVLEVRASSPDWCLVRVPTSGSVDSPPEGLVPLAVLKQPPPGLKTSPSRRHEHDATVCIRFSNVPFKSRFRAARNSGHAVSVTTSRLLFLAAADETGKPNVFYA